MFCCRQMYIILVSFHLVWWCSWKFIICVSVLLVKLDYSCLILWFHLQMYELYMWQDPHSCNGWVLSFHYKFWGKTWFWIVSLKFLVVNIKGAAYWSCKILFISAFTSPTNLHPSVNIHLFNSRIGYSKIYTHRSADIYHY